MGGTFSRFSRSHQYESIQQEDEPVPEPGIHFYLRFWAQVFKLSDEEEKWEKLSEGPIPIYINLIENSQDELFRMNGYATKDIMVLDKTLVKDTKFVRKDNFFAWIDPRTTEVIAFYLPFEDEGMEFKKFIKNNFGFDKNHKLRQLL